MHQKTMVVNGIGTTVGTTNFDKGSPSLSDESNVGVYDRRLLKEIEQIVRAKAGRRGRQ